MQTLPLLDTDQVQISLDAGCYLRVFNGHVVVFNSIDDMAGVATSRTFHELQGDGLIDMEDDHPAYVAKWVRASLPKVQENAK